MTTLRTDRFSNDLVDLMNRAEQLARESGRKVVEAVDILQAMLAHADIIAGALLFDVIQEFSLTLPASAAETSSSTGRSASTPGLSCSAETLLLAAQDEAKSRGQTFIGGEHVALAMLYDEHSPLARVMREKGVNVELARRRITGFFFGME